MYEGKKEREREREREYPSCVLSNVSFSTMGAFPARTTARTFTHTHTHTHTPECLIASRERVTYSYILK